MLQRCLAAVPLFLLKVLRIELASLTCFRQLVVMQFSSAYQNPRKRRAAGKQKTIPTMAALTTQASATASHNSAQGQMLANLLNRVQDLE